VLVILLSLAANFQSLKLSLVVLSTAPAVIAGVVLALWLTHTTINIQSFMGAIMAVGVAVANAILLVTFAERSRFGGAEATAAAVEGAQSRLRPILMTSFAMMAGMLPMALALGEGGEQTASLGVRFLADSSRRRSQRSRSCLPSLPSSRDEVIAGRPQWILMIH